MTNSALRLRHHSPAAADCPPQLAPVRPSCLPFSALLGSAIACLCRRSSMLVPKESSQHLFPRTLEAQSRVYTSAAIAAALFASESGLPAPSVLPVDEVVSEGIETFAGGPPLAGATACRGGASPSVRPCPLKLPPSPPPTDSLPQQFPMVIV
jgi:hypothetical protein